MDYFNLKFHNTNVKNEIFAGIALFMAMSYVLVVCPAILSEAGMNYTGVFLATVCVSGITTLISAFYTKLPIALAPGIGMISMFYNLAVAKNAVHWNCILLATYISGIIICAFVRFGLYDKIMEIMDYYFRKVIMCGVGLALLFYGVSTTGLLEKQTGYYIIGHVEPAPVLICLVSILVIYVSQKKNNKYFILIGLLSAYFLSISVNYYEQYVTNHIKLNQYLVQIFKFSYDVGDIRRVMFSFSDITDLVTGKHNILLFINATYVYAGTFL